MWLQNLVIVGAVGGCAGFLARQGYLALAGKKSKLGSCCDKGCGAALDDAKKASADSGKEKIQFIPVEMLGRRIK